MNKINIKNNKIAVIIPYYNAQKHIVEVIDNIPVYINKIYIVDDRGNEELPISRINDNRLIVLNNQKNLGVGGAMKNGFKAAIADQMDIVIKMDADNQMDSSYIPELLHPLIKNKFQYSKGNRFKDLQALKNMPSIRKIGNLGLSFLTKMATGYWNNFDPTNGFFAIKVEILKKLNFNNIDNRYFFETSLIAELYHQEAKIFDVTMPAIYGEEKSSMKVWTIPFIFFPKLFKVFFQRIVKSYFLFDFNIASLYIITGLPLFFFGIGYGVYNWVYYSSKNILTPTGTIMIATITLILGFQLLLQAIQFDIQKAPKSK
jgi:glycosyltransferase involved in cell wall biosynthesis